MGWRRGIGWEGRGGKEGGRKGRGKKKRRKGQSTKFGNAYFEF
jgi:hypothetical protein